MLPMRVFETISLAIWTWVGPFDQLADAQQSFSAAQAVLSSQLHLFVPVSINGTRRTWWLVDTGAPVSIVSNFLRQRLSLPGPPAGSGINATIMSRGKAHSVAFAISINLNGTELGPDYLRVEQINHLVSEKSSAVTAGFEKGGIMGMSQLLRRGTFINYKTLQLFFARGNSKLPLTRKGYEKMGFTYVPLRITPKGYIEVEGTIAGSTYSFLLDTGAFVSILEPKIRERNHLAFNDTRVILTAPYAGIKEVRLTQATVPGFRIGSQDLSDFRIGFAESHNFDPGFRHEYGGILGPDLLHYHEALIDLGNRALYLKPDYRGHKR